jgi:glutamine synthetase
MDARHGLTGPGETRLGIGRLGTLLEKSPSEWTADDLVVVAREQGIRSLGLMHVGSDGWLKTLDFVIRDEGHLRDILEAGERADGSSLFVGIAADASDIVMRPRLSTAFLDPFSEEPRLGLLCSHYAADGSPLAVSPDTIVRRAFERVQEIAGLQLWALGEVEYFLGKHAADADIYGSDDRGYHATSPFVFGEELRRRAMIALGEMGVPVKYGHSEVGYIEADEADGRIWEQHEIELALAPLPVAADAVVLTQWVLRNLAHRHGLRCNLDPVVRHGHAGSGLHFHLSPFLDGEHLRVIEEGRPTPEASWIIAGLVECGGALMAFGNRTAHSFVRLRQGKEVPETITWGRSNRRALVRLPLQITTADGRFAAPPTIEFRLPDGSVHPHLLLAGVAQAMLAAHGEDAGAIHALLQRTQANRETVASDDNSVPHTFGQVAEALAANRERFEAGEVFPASAIHGWIDGLQSLESASS